MGVQVKDLICGVAINKIIIIKQREIAAGSVGQGKIGDYDFKGLFLLLCELHIYLKGN